MDGARRIRGIVAVERARPIPKIRADSGLGLVGE